MTGWREKLRKLGVGAQGAAKELGSAVDAINAWKKQYGIADPDRLANLSFGNSYGGMHMPKSDYNLRARPKPKAKRHDEFDRDERDIHIHIKLPRRPRY
jgi:hypothetical protein